MTPLRYSGKNKIAMRPKLREVRNEFAGVSGILFIVRCPYEVDVDVKFSVPHVRKNCLQGIRILKNLLKQAFLLRCVLPCLCCTSHTEFLALIE